ncbi:hypothetical protein [Paenibacillus sp. YN15]|uniref:hypothetical protein n=1 Tax=Paenibacillus sp. YN15 TaxID=1742774 RepID=UPI0015EB3D61|nr:hypothetical protein [Paenibacillus sp. YN15]
MNETLAIIQLTGSYLQYLSVPLLVFCSLAAADMIVDFVVGLVRQTRKAYKL